MDWARIMVPVSGGENDAGVTQAGLALAQAKLQATTDPAEQARIKSVMGKVCLLYTSCHCRTRI